MMESIEPQLSIEEFYAEVEIYTAQRERRRAQAPWLAVSLVSFLIAFIGSAAWMVERSAWLSALVIVTVVVCVWSMTLAGRESEEDPPKDGHTRIRAALSRYSPINKSAYAQLVNRIILDRWRLADLIEFLNGELRARRSSLMFPHIAPKKNNPP